jgi:uncharacterized protein with LGFP repeats
MICYSIDQKYQNYGGIDGALGAPTSQEVAINDAAGGRYRHYRGRLFGAHGNMISLSLHGAHPTCDSPELGSFTAIKSSIYWTAATCAHVVQGEIRDLWAKRGWEKSSLGYPISDEMSTPDGRGRMSRFQHGDIWWYPNRGAFVCHEYNNGKEWRCCQ